MRDIISNRYRFLSSGVKLAEKSATHLHLAPSLRLRGAIQPRPHTSEWYSAFKTRKITLPVPHASIYEVFFAPTHPRSSYLRVASTNFLPRCSQQLFLIIM